MKVNAFIMRNFKTSIMAFEILKSPQTLAIITQTKDVEIPTQMLHLSSFFSVYLSYVKKLSLVPTCPAPPTPCSTQDRTSIVLPIILNFIISSQTNGSREPSGVKEMFYILTDYE